jgi:hypothetical protein
MIILLISISLIAYAFAGFCEAIFEGIWYYDTVSYYFKSEAAKIFWSQKAFYGTKDRNNDGVVSYWEKTFIWKNIWANTCFCYDFTNYKIRFKICYFLCAFWVCDY